MCNLPCESETMTLGEKLNGFWGVFKASLESGLWMCKALWGSFDAKEERSLYKDKKT